MAETRNQENASNTLNRFGALASDMLSAPLPPDTRVPDVRFMSPGILAGIPGANDFTTALGVKTVRDGAVFVQIGSVGDDQQAVFAGIASGAISRARLSSSSFISG